MTEHPIYLVDDDDAVCRSVSFMLKTSGHTVESYADGVEFIKEAKSLEPGCVLLDIQMPEMDGLEVQQELKAQGIAFPVVVMTGHGDVDVAVKVMKAGAIDFIDKPFAKDVMLSAVGEGFDKIDNSSAKSTRSEEAKLLLNGLYPARTRCA